MQNGFKVMKKLTSAALLVGAALVACQSASAQFTADDLYLGFQNQAGGGTEDYIINLGAASGIVGQSSVVNLSSDFSLSDFDAVLGTSTSLFGGVVGGSAAANPTSDVYLTQLRSGGAGTPSVAGSSVSATFTRSLDNQTISPLSNLNAPAAGTGILDTSKTWEGYVEPTFTTQSFYGNSGINPDSAVSPSSVLYEDLWYTSKSTISGSAGFTYEGYFTLDLTGSQPLLTFTGVSAVPEPATYALLSGAGLLMLVLRRRWTGGIA